MATWEILKRHDVRSPKVVIEEADGADLYLSRALAMLEMETGIPQQNIFGCDHGEGRAFCHERVTHSRVRRLLDSGLSNGVGWTQLTYRPFVFKAERIGGAEIPRYQMRVGFDVLSGLIRDYGEYGGFRSYNGSGDAAEAYARRAVGIAAKWRRRLH